MPKKERISTLNEQVAQFEAVFNTNAAYKAEKEAILLQKSLEKGQKVEWFDLSYDERTDLNVKHTGHHWSHPPDWNWDGTWDGELVRAMYALEEQGFFVVSFERSRKIRLVENSDLTQVEAFAKIHECVGDVASIKFTHGGTWIHLAKTRRTTKTKTT